jgi:hypothetical protein
MPLPVVDEPGLEKVSLEEESGVRVALEVTRESGLVVGAQDSKRLRHGSSLSNAMHRC